MSDQPILVVHAVPDLRMSAGGIASALPTFLTSLQDDNIDYRVFTFACDADSQIASKVALLAQGPPWQLARALQSEIKIWRTQFTGGNNDVVFHNHGLWSVLNHALSREARAQRVPLVISPHGMLLPWARRHKALRKSLAWRLYQERDLALAASVHVTSDAELLAVRNAGIKVPITVVPLGVTLPPARPWIATSRGDRSPSNQTLLFLGRVHPIKNLATLIGAFADAQPEGWDLVIAGPDEMGHVKDLQRLTAKFGIAERVRFEGPVFGNDKDRLFNRANVLVLPSHSENYGAVVAEALAHGIPAIASTGTPWSSLETEGCGWWVRPDRTSLSHVLRSLPKIDPEEFRKMGERGRTYVEQNLTWRSSAGQMAALYRRLVNERISMERHRYAI